MVDKTVTNQYFIKKNLENGKRDVVIALKGG